MDTMRDVIARLVELQSVLKEIYDIEQMNKRLPEGVEQMKRNLEPLKREIETSEAELCDVETRQGQLAVESQELQDRLQEISRRMTTISKTRELEAVELEFSSANERISDCNRQIKETRSRHDALVKRLEEMRPEYDQNLEKIVAEETKVQDEVAKNQLQIDELRARRQTMVVGVDMPTLNRFEKIVNSKNGIGIVPVINDSCDGCHMRIPPQMIGKVKRCQELVTCLNCSRILYL
ncbi:MAG TPA: C4-type zinc ribbon domain-containing protein [Spirochaetota bacterium]|nr:C4-type zinc ribbon domain-containing protein [Spirochaetota bacterium]